MDTTEPYVVSARKYRPATFDTVVGQRALTDTLLSAIRGNRLAQAYLFCGPRGVGKTSCARIFARTINCQNPGPDGEACGECDSCRSMLSGSSTNIIELDAASNNSIDDIRNLADQVSIPPQGARYRVFIIDEVHMLSQAAFNAFLKTLEEPPSYVIFILATTEKHKVLPTILSRCQIYDFKRIGINDIVGHLKSVAEREGYTYEDNALSVIARKADGAMRDALSIFDQVAASTRGALTYQATLDTLNVVDYEYYFRLVDIFTDHNVEQALLLYNQILELGFDGLRFIAGVASHIRDLMVAASPATAVLLETTDDLRRRYVEQSSRIPHTWFYTAIDVLNRCDLDYRIVTDKRLHIELALIRLCRIGVNATTQSAQSGPAPKEEPARQAPSQQKAPAAREQAPEAVQTPQNQPQQSVRPQMAARPAAAPRAVAAPRPVVRPAAAPQPVAPVRRPASVDKPVAASAPQPVRPVNPAPSPAAETPPPAAPTQSVPLDSAWNEFIAANPKQHILLAAMRNAETALAGDTLTVTVDSEPSRIELENAASGLADFLRRRTGVGNLAIKVEVKAAGAKRKVLTPKEFVTQVASENKVIRDLLRDLDAEFT